MTDFMKKRLIPSIILPNMETVILADISDEDNPDIKNFLKD